ncbi:hypothetical protein F5I97DRAFT_1453919 [Phlebopus sp. FC_14]|nr:hypothetical protein F5I97DRAFT_1453919 [Phlebopus sp. FC_14]
MVYSTPSAIDQFPSQGGEQLVAVRALEDWWSAPQESRAANRIDTRVNNREAQMHNTSRTRSTMDRVRILCQWRQLGGCSRSGIKADVTLHLLNNLVPTTGIIVVSIMIRFLAALTSTLFFAGSLATNIIITDINTITVDVKAFKTTVSQFVTDPTSDKFEPIILQALAVGQVFEDAIGAVSRC